ncbi:hypothetical protein ARMSODRAFT_1015763 [Armillaria solidipes]|uniref:Fungal-type protein kinase domain-containing protein n=1 Tax=Armillaria solidipes TaxID=1076256 RepID=A0A2H3BPW4_9AGAR|nr:hypothetical protein ARMSODRAFT_1015763 [Armillaria solidipes]
MKEHRNSILRNIREIPAVPLEVFKQNFLPRVVDPTQVDQIASCLRANGALLPNGRWASSPKDPAGASGEGETFKHLENIAAAIVKKATVLLNSEQTAPMQTKPRQAVVLEGRSGQFISDVHSTLYDSLGARVVQNETATAYIGVCQYDNNQKVSLTCDRTEIEEHKLKDIREDESDNNKEILRNAAQMLCGTSQELSFLINFISFTQEHKHFIYYVISMSFGSSQDLGYDTSVVRLAVPIDTNKKKQYDYVGNTYQTLECFSPLQPSGLSFRATRAWKVRKLGAGGEFVLKDVWIPLAAVEVQKHVSHLIEEAPNTPSLYKKYDLQLPSRRHRPSIAPALPGPPVPIGAGVGPSHAYLHTKMNGRTLPKAGLSSKYAKVEEDCHDSDELPTRLKEMMICLDEREKRWVYDCLLLDGDTSGESDDKNTTSLPPIFDDHIDPYLVARWKSSLDVGPWTAAYLNAVLLVAFSA